MQKHLIIPDSHAMPGINNDRFEWLGKLIIEEKPNKVINIGDFADMPSLCSYEKGKRSFEGRRYKKDCEAVIDAQKRLFEPITQYKKSKKVSLNFELHMTLGNHDEGRINRATQLDPILFGTIGVEDLKYAEFGWKTYPYKEIVNIDGIFYSHFFTKGVMDSPISGTTATLGANIVKEMKDNAICGHSHLLSYCNAVLPDGRKIIGLSSGCYFEHKVDYVSNKSQQEWWRGITVLTVHNKEIKDLTFISMESIKREYK